MRTAGAAVLRRQGLRGAPSSRDEGLLAAGNPFPVVHVDAGHNFDEVLAFRDRRVAQLGVRLIVPSVQESIDRGEIAENPVPGASRHRLRSHSLLKAIAADRFDAVPGWARTAWREEGTTRRTGPRGARDPGAGERARSIVLPARTLGRRWFTRSRLGPTTGATTSSSSAAAQAATPRPSTARPRACRSRWSKRTRSAAPACTGAASPPRSSSRRRASTGRSRAQASSASRPRQPTVDFSVSLDRKGKVVDQLFRGLTGLLKRRQVTPSPASDSSPRTTRSRVTGADGSVTELSGTNVVLASGSVPRLIPGFEAGGVRPHLGRGA